MRVPLFAHKNLNVLHLAVKQQICYNCPSTLFGLFCPLSPSCDSLWVFLPLSVNVRAFLFLSCSWSSLLSIPPTYPPVCLSIHHRLIHHPVQLRPGPNLASGPYLCTVSRTWQLTVSQVLFFIGWLCCCLTFLAVRRALAVDFLPHHSSVCDTKSSNDSCIVI